MTSKVSVVVLAAGKGTRMRNTVRKVLHPLAGRSLIAHVMDAVAGLDPDRSVVVLAPGMEDVLAACQSVLPRAAMAIQDPPMGTGHAVQSALPDLPRDGHVVVVFGDTPLITSATLQKLLDQARSTGAAVTVLGMRPPDPTGYGRLAADGEDLTAIVEHAHASEELRSNAACNSGVMVLDAARLDALVADLPLAEEKGEYYLTDSVELAVKNGWRCTTIDGPWQEGMGVNCQAQLAEAEALYQARARGRLLDSGVIMTAPDTVYLSFDTDIGAGSVVEPFVVFGPGCRIAGEAVVRAHSHLEGALVGRAAVVGPFARLRPGTYLEARCRIGNFVETKNAIFGEGSKANHLTYVGDASIGRNVNIGAGTITCNYDGFNKHQTVLGDNVFVGSNTALVAPVVVGDGATIGAGSTITRDIEGDALALARANQANRDGMASRLRRRLQKQKAKKS